MLHVLLLDIIWFFENRCRLYEINKVFYWTEILQEICNFVYTLWIFTLSPTNIKLNEDKLIINKECMYVCGFQIFKSVIRTIFPTILEDADVFWKLTEIVHYSIWNLLTNRLYLKELFCSSVFFNSKNAVFFGNFCHTCPFHFLNSLKFLSTAN